MGNHSILKPPIRKKKTCISVFLKINGNYTFYLKIHMFSFDQQQETWLRWEKCRRKEILSNARHHSGCLFTSDII